MDHKKRIIFVDDQPEVLSGLRRMLHTLNDEWAMTFCESGMEALSLMKRQPFDLIVSDMMMPEMNGAQLLAEVNRHYPWVVRFILSGHTDAELIMQSVGNAHQYIAKPCNAEALKQHINSSFGIRSFLGNQSLHARIAEIRTLPSLPETYNEVVHELQSESSSIGSIAALISRDVSLSAKLLQIVNSAFFGLPRRVDRVEQAVSYLGLNTVKGLVLTAGVYEQMKDADIPHALLQSIFNHSTAVGGLARDTASKIGLSQLASEDAMLAGYLHDIGKIVLFTNFKEEMSAVNSLMREKSLQASTAEKDILGVDHGEVGAHLLSIWGLHDPILEAVAFHHNPQHVTQPTKSILTAVYIANAIHHYRPCDGSSCLAAMDRAYLEGLDLIDCLPSLYGDLRTEDIEEGITR